MGLLSPNNVPIVRQPVISSGNNKSQETDTQEEDLKAYLDKRRGKQGTVSTSWQGLLEKDEEIKNQKKTLLGE